MATPQDDYQVPARAGFIGQVGNIGSNNGLAGNSQNSSVGGTATNGVQSSNSATSAAFAVVQTVGGPVGMGAGGGASEGQATASSTSPGAIQQDVSAAKNGEEPAQFTGALASPAALGVNVNFPSTNGESVVLPVNNGFSQTANDVSVSNTGATSKAGITDTLTNAGVNDLTRTQVDNFETAEVNPNKKVDGADSPLGDPEPQPRTPLADDTTTSSSLPVE